MRWAWLERVQPVSALLATGAEAPQRLAAAMAAKPGSLRALPFAYGAGWATIFAGSADERQDEAAGLLPHLPGTTPLYEAVAGIWLPVGVGIAAPCHVQAQLLQAMLERHALAAPAIIVPRRPGEDDAEADVYVIGKTIALDRLQFESDALGNAA